MKTTSVSTLALTNATRETRINLQMKLAIGQKEASTGRYADVGVQLGYLTQRTVSLRQDLDRLTTFKDTNAVAASRLSLSQAQLDGLADGAQGFLTTLMAARSATSSAGTAVTDAKAKLTSFTAALNTTVNGAHLFAGVNTDIKPISDYFGTPTSAGRQAVADGFTTEFGIPQSTAGVENVTGAQMDAFLDGAFANLFGSADWATTWSSASDQNITSRITTNERIETSANANDKAFRGLAQAYTMIADLGIQDLNSDAYQAVVNKAIDVVGQAISDLTALRASLGTSQERIKDADSRIDIQMTLMKEHIGTLEGVDPYEAQVKVNELLKQIETAYALTARTTNLSLLKYL